MGKLTEKVLLEKGLPKSNTLEHIKTLNLSKMGLKMEDLPSMLCSRLVSLERLDLSGNLLAAFPKNVDFPKLISLDLSDNQMEKVTSLERLKTVEELKMDDNLYVTVSDNYKLMVLLPNLRVFNGKDVSTTANHVRYVYTDNLRTRIECVWQKSFGRRQEVMSLKQLVAVETQFVTTATQEVKYGPNSVSDFTKWRVGILAKEFLDSLKNPKEEIDQSEDSEEEEELSRRTPSKKRKRRRQQNQNLQPGDDVTLSDDDVTVLDDDVILTPRKRMLVQFPESPIHTHVKPKNSSPIHTPIKTTTHNHHRDNNDNNDDNFDDATRTNGVRISPRKKTPTKKKMEAAIGQEVNKKKKKKKKKEEEEEEVETHTNKKEKERQNGVQMNGNAVSIHPVHVLQCHSKNDSREDFNTQLWACSFQPTPDYNASDASRLVATCGGESLCVIDCETGLLMKKYKVPGEEFFSLCWSTVMMSPSASANGKTDGAKTAKHCSILAAGGKRGVVKLLHPRNNVSYGEFRASKKSLSVLKFSSQQGNFLFTGSYDNKIVLWDIGGVDSQYNYKVVVADMEVSFPIYQREDSETDYHTVDGLAFLNEDIVASKNHLCPVIYLWSFSETVSQKKKQKTKSVCAVVLCELQWTQTQVPYLSLNTCPGQSIVVCGDDVGRLWTYHIQEKDLKRNNKSDKPIKPTQIYDWPAPVVKGLPVGGANINSVAMDTQLNFLVALTDKNMMIIYKRD